MGRRAGHGWRRGLVERHGAGVLRSALGVLRWRARHAVEERGRAGEKWEGVTAVV